MYCNQVGNAAVHSFKYHAGTCAFFEIQGGFIYIYAGRRMHLSYEACIDNLGNEFKDFTSKYDKFDRFTLNNEELKDVYRLITNQSILEKIVSKALSSGTSYKMTFY